jgi:two-component system, chemotaxis family, chemotaxis protein CheY
MTFKKRVLVVDDTATIRAQLVQILGEEFDCITANDGLQGLELAISQRPDAVVSDLEMPGLDGIGLLRELRKDPRTQGVPVVVVTTVTAVDRVNECRSLGCAGFVLKPVQAEYLKAKLRQIFQRKSS